MSASWLPTRGGTELLCHGKAGTIKEHNLSSAASSLPLFCATDATHCLPPTIYPYPATTDHVAPLRPLPLRTFAAVTTTRTTATVYTTATTDNVAPLLPLPLQCTLPPTPLRHPELSRLDSTTLYIYIKRRQSTSTFVRGNMERPAKGETFASANLSFMPGGERTSKD